MCTNTYRHILSSWYFASEIGVYQNQHHGGSLSTGVNKMEKGNYMGKRAIDCQRKAPQPTLSDPQSLQLEHIDVN